MMLMTRMISLTLALLLDPMPQGAPPARPPAQAAAAAFVPQDDAVFVARDKVAFVGEQDKDVFVTQGNVAFVGEQDKTAVVGEANPDTTQKFYKLVDLVYQNQLANQVGPANYVWAYTGASDDGLGASLAPAEGAIRAQLNLPEGQGIVVAAVTPGGPAEQAGLKADDILLTLAGKPLDKSEALTARLKEAGEAAVELALIRSGKPLTIQVKPLYHVTFAPAEPEKPRPYIGVSTAPVDSTLRSHLPDLPADRGLIVTEVVDDSPAAKVGLSQGDILLELGDQALTDFEALAAKVRSSEGQKLAAKLVRGGKTMALEVTPVPRPHAEEQAQASQPAEAALLWRAALADGTARWVDVNLAGAPVANDQQSLNWIVSKLDSQIQQGQAQQQVIAQALEALAKSNTAKPADGVEKRLDELASQIKQLGDAVDELRQAVRAEKEGGAKGR